MGINKEKYTGKFIDEGLEHIATIETLLFDVKDGGSLEDDFACLLRALHTLKGSARMLEFSRIEALTHALESVFIGVKEQRVPFSDKAIRLSLASLDLLKTAFASIQKTKTDAIETSAFEQELSALAANEDFTIPASKSPKLQAAPEAPPLPQTPFEVPVQPAEQPPPKSLQTQFAQPAEQPPSTMLQTQFAQLVEQSPPQALQTQFAQPAEQSPPTMLQTQFVQLVEQSPPKTLQTQFAQPAEQSPPKTLQTQFAQRAEQSPPKALQTQFAQVVPQTQLVKSESIRIPLKKINDIIKNMASLQSLEIMAKNIARETEAVHEVCTQFLRQFITEQQVNSPLVREGRKLEQVIRNTASKMKNYAIDVGNHTKSAYDSVISLRMLPLSTVLDAYHRYVFEIAAELGKQVRLRIEGADHEIDKNIIETLSDVFIHTVRNAIDHGIETPEKRRERGKDETGILSIRCTRESGTMKIRISDDGQGIDTEAIRAKIMQQELVSKETAAQLSREELTNYIFQNGFSTASTVSAVSGRGVGMDVVRSSVERMKGSILVESTPGKGTCFTILVPLSIASLIGFPISCGEMKFIIPANFVDTVLLVNKTSLITVVDHPGIKFNGHIIKLYYLNQILHIDAQEQRQEQESLFVVIIKAYDESIALAIDSISNMRSVILKSMPSFMEGMRIFSGVVLSEDYEMVPALHVPSLITMAKRLSSFDLKKRHQENEQTRKAILVVDDSLHTREIEQDILQAEGYKVDTAADGSEALMAAKTNRYDLICTDLNMPQMDGFMLTENIRKNSDLTGIPIIVISSKSSEEDQKQAALLGANRYIIKNSFNNLNLITAVRDLIGEAHG
ncbi:MAG: hybrid sensor histidine kinase/response regulator [Treponema sp.]|jgi:chemotaxis protein histidine kinase CheA/CheY-like chemotaxis protein|nr:hybrid sensor histidine kinase/response regulator [Treponema sp.]